MTTSALISDLKQSDQDFEFYPTTAEIIRALIADLEHVREDDYSRRGLDSVLDIGAGHGKVLAAFEAAGFHKLYAIEKSMLLCQRLPDDVFIIGTEFHEQSLVSKSVDVTFCNPPYSEFEDWTRKIIRETASSVLYLVIPQRWSESLEIGAALAYRTAETKVVGSFDFLDSEDRRARAKVDLLRVTLCVEKDDAFDRFFNEEFADLRTKWDSDKTTERADEGSRRNPKLDALIVGQNYPEMLVNLYNEELDHIRKNYDLVKSLDVDLLREFDVSPERIMACLKARLAGLRNTYWQELFSHMSSVTNRLTSKKRRLMLETLNQSGHVDFTVSNIHAVLLWVMKNANGYMITQLLETFDTMISKANVKNYRSNERVFTFDRWRYTEEKPTHIALEYRIVLDRVGGVKKGSYDRGLDESAADFMGDLLTVAHGLGFIGKTTDHRLNYHGRKDWIGGEKQEFRCLVDGQSEILFEVRAFQNRNIHLRLNQKFALALNVEVGRLRGWIHSGQEAADELSEPTAAKYYGTNHQLGTHSLLLT